MTTLRSLNFTNIAYYPPNLRFDALRIWWNISIGGGVSWADINPSAGVYRWGGIDSWLAKATGKPIMYTAGRTPAWIGGGADFKNPPSDVNTTDATWKSFINAMATRYKGKIEAYGIWNEPDIAWNGTAAQLVIMGRDAYQIIHTVDPAAKVISPEPSTSNEFGVHFLPAYFAAGGAPYQDIIGCHFYQYDSKTGKRARSAKPYVQNSINSLKALAHQYSLDALPIWYTEGGWGQDADFTVPLTDTERVAWVNDNDAIMVANNIPRYYWYAYDNQKWGTLENTSTNTLTAAGQAFAQLTEQMVTISPLARGETLKIQVT